jgi:ubiquinone biosynthesis protein COQ4
MPKRTDRVGPADILRAVKVLRRLGEDPNRTDLVGEFIASLTGPSALALFRRVQADPIGRALLEEGRDLGAVLNDRAYLASLPAGSLGRAYLDWTAMRDFTAEGIAEAISAQVDRRFHDPRSVMAARVVDMHDLWHVLNGWDSDIYGEMHLLGYSYAQLGGYAWLILALLTNLVLATAGRTEGIGYLRNAIRRGRQATLLVAVDWEAMLSLPIGEVRQRLRVDEPVPYVKLTFAELGEIRRRSLAYKVLRVVLPG